MRAVETPEHESNLPQDSRLGKLSSLIGEPDFWGGVPPSLLPRENETGFYLKLHGSLDWLRCPTPNCPNNHRLYAIGIEPLGESQVAGRPCRLCGSALEIFIVPPVASKRIDDRGRLAFLWNLAFRELRDASQVAVVGLSLAPSDFDLRWLLRASMAVGHLGKLLIANPSLEARRETAALLGGPSVDLAEYDGLAELCEAAGRAVQT